MSVIGTIELFTARSGHCGFSIGTDIFLFGGQNEVEGQVYSSAFKFDTTSYEWSPLPNLPEPRHSGTCVLYKEKALIFAGANQLGVLDNLLIFDPGKN